MHEGKKINQAFVGETSGRELEWDVFGSINTRDARYQDELLKVAQGPSGYVPFRKGVELAKKFQTGDPLNPERPFSRKLRLAIMEALGLGEKENGVVKLYTAVGSPLDQWHGVDAFVELEKEGKSQIVTLDISELSQEEKSDRGQKIKADIFITEKDLNLEDEANLPLVIKKLAKEIAAQLKAKN